MIDKIVTGLLAFTLGFVILFCTLVIQRKDNQIKDLNNLIKIQKEEIQWRMTVNVAQEEWLRSCGFYKLEDESDIKN